MRCLEIWRGAVYSDDDLSSEGIQQAVICAVRAACRQAHLWQPPQELVRARGLLQGGWHETLNGDIVQLQLRPAPAGEDGDLPRDVQA